MMDDFVNSSSPVVCVQYDDTVGWVDGEGGSFLSLSHWLVNTTKYNMLRGRSSYVVFQFRP